MSGRALCRCASSATSRNSGLCRQARRCRTSGIGHDSASIVDALAMTQPPLPTPGQRVSGIDYPSEYRLPSKPDASERAEVQDGYRQTQFVLGPDLRLFAEGMNLQLQILNDSSHSRYRTHVYAAVVGTWSRAYSEMSDGCLLVTRGSYGSVPNLMRSVCELIAAEHQVKHEELGEFVGWMLRHLKPDEEHKAFDAGL